MKKLLLLVLSVSAFSLASKAQDTVKTTSDSPLVIFGSADAYYKYDFSGHNNIPTYYGTDQNSFSVGMIDFGFKKKVGKAAVVAELSFGPRSDASLPVPTNHIENLYVSYDVTDAFNITGGYMQTFVGYEVISPTGNFNYSTSYLFSAGPFQNAGVKATYTFSPAVSLMAGVFNDQWNVYSTNTSAGPGKINTFGAQLMVAPVKGWTAYLNLLTGPASGTIEDLTTTYQITDAFKLGLNAANKTGSGATNYKGAALYPQLAVSKAVTLGIRGEYFKPTGGTDILAGTLTANIKSGPLTFMPEIRFDNGKDQIFTDKNGMPTKTASQFLLAAVYAF
ncbi:porin [Mucilaginibacter corticis]|uniref:Porin n=1 Tax=Mucilaginibacter corticis TaxID=2597670 RepID=A0A556MBH4_9SPHI|nr:porin [Mucilaginibacter corticis]TSJ37253.1 porin [Mucilaginibacter corticis]